MKKQKDLLPYEKGFRAAGTILAVMAIVALIFDFLRVFDVLNIGFDLFIVVRLLLSFSEVCEAVALWRERRGTAILYIITALVLLVAATLDWTN